MNSFKTIEFNNNMNNIINEFINNVNEFNRIISINNIVLSGSSVLKAINDDKYDVKDLDIYINSNYKMEIDSHDLDIMHNALLSMCPDLYKFIKDTNNYKICTLMVSDRYKNINTLYSGMRSINYVFTFRNTSRNNKTIQFIICNNYYNTIKEFDLTINKNYWNGEYITITNPKIVFTKHEKLSLHIKCKLDYYTLERIDKYRKRGYNIELTELSSLLPKSIYNSKDLVQIITKTFREFVFED